MQKFWRGIAYLGMRNATGTILKPTVFLFTSTYSPRISGICIRENLLIRSNDPIDAAALPLLTPLLVHPFDTLYVRSVITQFGMIIFLLFVAVADGSSRWSKQFMERCLHSIGSPSHLLSHFHENSSSTTRIRFRLLVPSRTLSVGPAYGHLRYLSRSTRCNSASWSRENKNASRCIVPWLLGLYCSNSERGRRDAPVGWCTLSVCGICNLFLC